jgi:hypothetical protein
MVTFVFTMAILVLLLVLGVAYYAIQTSMTPAVSNSEATLPDEAPLTLTSETGTILSVSANELTIETTAGVEKRVVTGPGTSVYKTVSYSDPKVADGQTGLVSLEGSLSNVSVGDTITTTNFNDQDNVLIAVGSVSAVSVETDLDLATYMSLPENQINTINIYIEEVDVNNRTLSYYLLDNSGEPFVTEPISTVGLEDDLVVFQVEDLENALFSHRRTPMQFSDIIPGSAAAMVFSTNNPNVGSDFSIDTLVLLKN